MACLFKNDVERGETLLDVGLIPIESMVPGVLASSQTKANNSDLP